MNRYTTLFTTLILLLTTYSVEAQKIALVIGNSAYQIVPELKNPRNDAEDMTSTLNDLGFEVIKHFDLDHREMERVLDDFAGKLKNAQLALFFFAGHAIQVAGKNYLLPVDTPLLNEDHLLKLQRLHIGTFQRLMERKAETSILFIDACRDSPFGRTLARRSGTRSSAVGRGLGIIEAGSGTLISYATSPGATAADGDLRNSPYTASLKRRLRTPNHDLALVLREVRKDVMAATGGHQIPWTAESLTGQVILRRTTAPVVLPQVKPSGIRSKPQTQRVRKSETVPKRFVPDKLCRLSSQKRKLGACIHPGHGNLLRDRQKGGRACLSCPDLVAVPTGLFIPAGAKGYAARKNHRQFLTPFLISATEVTFAQWDACVEAGGCGAYRPEDNGWGRGDHPVINVSAKDAETYAAWLSKITGQRYALPTEAQWSYAGRAETKTDWWWGRKARSKYANFDNSSSSKILDRRPRPVTRFPQNPWGLKNIHGNVAEWTSSCWSTPVDLSLTPASARQRNGKTGINCDERVVRGGAFDSTAAYSRAGARQPVRLDMRRDTIGFRVVRMIDAFSR